MTDCDGDPGSRPRTQTEFNISKRMTVNCREGLRSCFFVYNQNKILKRRYF